MAQFLKNLWYQCYGLECDYRLLCTGLITAYGNAALYDEVSSAFNSMEESGCEPDQGTFNSLIGAYAGFISIPLSF